MLSAYESPVISEVNNHGAIYTPDALRMFGDELILKSLATDTISAINTVTGEIYPKFIKIPSNRGKDPSSRIWLDYSFETTRYASLFLLDFNFKGRVFSVDKTTGEVRESHYENRDILDKKHRTLGPNSMSSRGTKNVMVYVYEAVVLKDLYEQGLLEGELAKVASRMSENDNPVLMIMEFAE